MRNRVVNPGTAGRTTFGLIAWLEQTKITLPLKGVECAFNVCGDVVSVEIDQIFHQNNSRPLDCLYTFPLPASAAVYRCEMHVNGRVIRARVEERQRARELAQEKKAAGFRTALVEMERNNLFTLSLGNVQPGDLIVIRFAYFQTISRLGDWTSFSIPFCPGIRYIPGAPLLRSPHGRGVVDDTDQVPDASRISPPRMDRLHSDAAYLSLQGIVEYPQNDSSDISSPSHPVQIQSAKDASTVTIPDRSAVPDCDFVLRWTEAQPVEVRHTGWLMRQNGQSFALLRLGAPSHAPASDTYSQDVYFLIDRSGSMAGLKWQKAVEAFHAFLSVLSPEDRVWATFFESGLRDLAEKPLPVKALLADQAVGCLEALGTTGGTELLPALRHVTAKITEHSKERPASLVVITDGQVGNEAEILKALAQHSHLRVNVFGIDVSINDGFLQKLAAQHQGTSCLLSPQDDIAGAVTRLADRLRRPVLTSLRISPGWELPGDRLPDLYAGEILSVTLRAVSSEPTAPLTLDAKTTEGKSHSHLFSLVETQASAIPLLWAKRRIDFLIATARNSDAIELAKRNNIVGEGAAFIAWDESEKVEIAGDHGEIYQPAMQPRFLARAFGASASVGMFAAGKAESLFVDHLSELECHDVAPVVRMGEYNMDYIPNQGDVSSWWRELEKDVLFQSPAGKQLLALFEDWLRLRPKQVAQSVQHLTTLAESLKQARNRPLTERLEILNKWIESALDGDFRKRALEVLDTLVAKQEKELQK